MRKSIVCLSVLMSSLSFSQNENSLKDKLDFGFRFGLSLSDLITKSNTLTPRTSFLTGIHVDYAFNSTWSIQPELLYARKGESTRSTEQSSGVRIEERLFLDYFELPIFIKYHFNKVLAFETGVYISYFVAATQESIEGTAYQTSNVLDHIENTDAGIAIGPSYKTVWNFFPGIRYSRGFMNLSNNTLQDFEDQYNAQF